ncbi:MAG: hypothetical protein WCE54_13240 [Ignavibacteriaceae bacterium]
MNDKKKIKPAFISIVAVVLFAVTGWILIQNQSDKDPEQGNKNKSTSRINLVNGITTIEQSPEEQIESGITTEKLAAVKQRIQTTAYGYIIPVSDLSKDVQTYQSGKAQLAKAKEDLSVLKPEYERKKILYEKQLVSEQEYQSAKAAYLSDQADINSAAANLNTLKNSLIEEFGSKLSDWIFNDSRALQKLLSFKDKLIQISPEEADIKIPVKIFIQTSSNDKRIPCRFISSGHLANVQFQTRTLYYIISGIPGSQLAGGSNVKAYLPAGEKLEGVFVPSESIILYEGSSWVYIKISKNKFQRIKVNTDNPAENGFFIRSKNKLKPGAIIVKDGAQLLLSEELNSQTKNSGAGEEDND